jgi:hypothetical protein
MLTCPCTPPPHERLVELVEPQHQRECSEAQVLPPTVDMTEDVDADRSHHDTADEISLRRETHPRPFRYS